MIGLLFFATFYNFSDSPIVKKLLVEVIEELPVGESGGEEKSFGKGSDAKIASNHDVQTLPGGSHRSTKRKDVLLFCRIPKENYCCLGTVSVYKYDVLSHPIEILWRLNDYEKLQRDSPYFLNMVSVAS